ncbi:hypothetical protein Cni_G02084 [Canna indica]|uniref:Uncharacterized protein n=1 Tax=Canna indica TaxID=4628 RepID=A0AAQ3JPF8_9LILI|nr:hypothetical protein Cni_G02084 [Canna indica]
MRNESHFLLLQKNLDANLRCKNSLAENEVLAASNSKLKEELVAHQHKINEVNELIKSIHDEKEAAVEQLASHTGTIAKLTDQQSRGLELHFATQSLLKENEAQLHEAIKQHNQKDLETKELQQKLISHETKLITYQELASESALVAATRKGKLEEAVLRIQDQLIKDQSITIL